MPFAGSSPNASLIRKLREHWDARSDNISTGEWHTLLIQANGNNLVAVDIHKHLAFTA